MAIAVVLQQQTMRVVRFHVETYQRVQLTISFSKNYPNFFFVHSSKDLFCVSKCTALICVVTYDAGKN